MNNDNFNLNNAGVVCHRIERARFVLQKCIRGVKLAYTSVFHHHYPKRMAGKKR